MVWEATLERIEQDARDIRTKRQIVVWVE